MEGNGSLAPETTFTVYFGIPDSHSWSSIRPNRSTRSIGFQIHPYQWHTSQLQKEIPTAKQIDAAKHPQITFISTHCSENVQKKKFYLQNQKEVTTFYFMDICR